MELNFDSQLEFIDLPIKNANEVKLYSGQKRF